MLKKLLLFVSFYFVGGIAFGQLDNTAFFSYDRIDSTRSGQLRFGVNSFGFFKNNEYSNKIADGFTLFGYQLNPQFEYQPNSFVKVAGGVFLWKDFGTDKLVLVRPTFTIAVEQEKYSLLFGNINSTVQHKFIEPLYDFERVISQPLENGFQFYYHDGPIWIDSWIDWRKMIKKGSPFREEFTAGLSSEIDLLNSNEKFRLYMPIQGTAEHKGGQIDDSDLPVQTLLTGALGFGLEKKFEDKILQSLKTENYIVGFTDNSGVKELAFSSGNGLYLNAGAETKFLTLMVSYWKGSGFVSQQGGQLFQSMSTTFKNRGYIEKNRELVIFRFLRDFNISENLVLTLRFEPLYDFNNPKKKIEFSHGLYFNYRPNVLVKQLKK